MLFQVVSKEIFTGEFFFPKVIICKTVGHLFHQDRHNVYIFPYYVSNSNWHIIVIKTYLLSELMDLEIN